MSIRLISPKPALQKDITRFHSGDYLACLKKLSETEDDEKYDEEAEAYGLSNRQIFSLRITKFH